jgi:long-chain acyl-CoA synthetase
MLSPDAVARCAAPDAKQALTGSLARHLETVNARLEPHEKLGFLVVIATTWTPENGFVTPTFKVKRMQIEAAYGNQFASWQAQRQPVVWADH